jgi:hypothetical protein
MASNIIFPSTCLALILVIGGLHFLWNTKTEFVEATETAQASLTLGVCWSMVQQLGVISLVRIDWPSEVNFLIAVMTWAIVDITPLQVDSEEEHGTLKLLGFCLFFNVILFYSNVFSFLRDFSNFNRLDNPLVLVTLSLG